MRVQLFLRRESDDIYGTFTLDGVQFEGYSNRINKDRKRLSLMVLGMNSGSGLGSVYIETSSAVPSD